MNRVYRTVFNRALGVWQVAAEITRSHGKSRSTGRAGKRRVGLLALLPLSAWASLAWAVAPSSPQNLATRLPTGGAISAGRGNIGQRGTGMTITQQSQNLAINWQSFDIGRDASVTFEQPNASAIALNRVLGTDGTQILGQLKANGQVWVLNPNGVLFGSGAQVSVGGLVASTLGLSDADFLAGKRSFSDAGGTVSNQGRIAAGYVALLGEQVKNGGVIVARLGTAALAAGNKVTLDFSGDQLLNVQVDEGALHALADNRGLIQADGGTVLMTARAKDALLDTAVNNRGVINARTIENRGGRILLLGDMDSGTVQVDGTLDASALGSGNGGFVETSAAQVAIADSARITTKSAGGRSGTWLIDPNDFTVAASGGNMTGAAVGDALQNNGNFTIQTATSGTAGGRGDINVNDAVSWSSNSTLTLQAERSVNVNAAITATGSGAGLEVFYNDGAGITDGNFHVNSTVNLPVTGSLAINGQSYTLIDSLTGLGDLSGYYALAQDFDTPVTASLGNLGGTLEGLGHSINDINIDAAGNDYVGLFGALSQGSLVRNLHLAGSVSGKSLVGLLAGRNLGTVINVHGSGSVNASGQLAGGLLGENGQQTGATTYIAGAVEGSSSSATVAGGSSNAFGGLVGSNSRTSTITDSHATGNVTGAQSVGGLAGSNGGTITYSYATGDATATNGGAAYAGGLAGTNVGTIAYTYATGTVTGADLSGGLVGRHYAGATIDNSYATGQVNGSGSYIGGLVGTSMGGTVTNSYWDTYSTGKAAGVGGGSTVVVTAVTSDPTQSAAANYAFKKSAYTGLDFGGDWFMADGSSRPMLRAFLNEADSNGLIAVTNLYQLQGMAANLGGHYLLTQNIDATATANSTNLADVWGGKGFASVGNANAAFTGSFDGQDHVIDGLTIHRLATDGVGLFGYTNGVHLSRVGLTDADIQGNNFVGVLLGRGKGDNRIDNAWSSGSVLSQSTNTLLGGVGGLVGQLYGIVSNSHSSATVEGTSNVGGLVGRLGDSLVDTIANQITHSHATGDVRANVGSGGGLVGRSGGRVDNSHATGNVAGGRSLGGLIGIAETAVYWVNAPASPQFLIDINYATGNVTGNQSTSGAGAGSNAYGNYIGGLVGAVQGGSVTMGNSFATGNVSGYDGVGGLVGYVEPNSAPVTSPSLFNTYAAVGTVTGNNYVGGLVGQVEGYFQIWQSYAANGLLTATASAPKVGGIVGYQLGTGDRLSINTAVWNRETTGTDHMSGGDFMGPPGHVAGYLTGEDYLASRHSVGATTAQMQTLEPYYMAGFYGGNYNDGGFTILTDSTAAGRDFVEDDPLYGSLFNVFRMYEGKTYPLLMAFLTNLEVSATPDYDGSGAALGNIASATLLDAPSGAHILGTGTVVPGDTLTLTSTQDGSYIASTNAYVSGLYSDSQFGYNIRAGNNSRVISTPGSVAGEIQLPASVTWSSGNLVIDNSGAITTAGAGGTNSTAINGQNLQLTNGTWTQDAGTLPGFSLTGDFRLNNATFLRAADGTGDDNDPWRLTDVYGLQGMASAAHLGSSFALANDIDASGTAGWNGGAGFVPVGNGTTAFTGNFDGGDHTISGLTLSRSGSDYVGLFGHAAGGSLADVTLSQASVQGGANVGMLAGQIDSGTTVSQVHVDGTVNASSIGGGLVGNSSGDIIDSSASGSVTVSQDHAGGLVAQSDGAGRISGSSADVTVQGGTHVGGLVGSIEGTVNDSHATGDVTATSNVTGVSSAPDQAAYAGGLIGYAGTGAQVANSYATGDVAASNGSQVGGLVGETHAGISGSFATGKVSGYGYVGGLVGKADTLVDPITSSYATGAVQNGVYVFDDAAISGPDWAGGLVGWSNATITETYATGAVTPVGSNTGGLVGQQSGGSINNSFYATTDASNAAINNSGVGQILVDDPWRGNSNGIGKTLTELRQATTFAGWNMSTTGGSHAVWRIYEGHASPLLRHFMTAVSVSADLSGGKTYDGSIASGTVDAYTTSVPVDTGLLAGSLTYITNGVDAGTYNTADSSLQVSGELYSGQLGYDIDYSGNNALTIAKANATVTAKSATASYDGQAHDVLGFTVTGLVNGENAGVLDHMTDAAASGRNAGTYAHTVSGSDNNYNLTFVEGSLTVDKASLTVGADAVTKTYDGTTGANGTAIVSGGQLFGGDSISGGHFTFTDKNAGTGKTVTVGGVAVDDGNGGGNYDITYVANTHSSIDKADITIGSGNVTKTYDGTTRANGTAIVTGGTLFGTDAISGGHFAFTDKNAGTGKTVTVNGVTVDDSNNGGNYHLSYIDNTGSRIDRKILAVDGHFDAADKPFDGRADAVISSHALGLGGVVAGDAVTADWKAAFADAGIGTAKPVYLEGTTLAGSDSLNYRLDLADAPTASADILRAAGALPDTPAESAGEHYAGVLHSVDADAAVAASLVVRQSRSGTESPDITVLQCGQNLPAQLTKDCR